MLEALLNDIERSLDDRGRSLLRERYQALGGILMGTCRECRQGFRPTFQIYVYDDSGMRTGERQACFEDVQGGLDDKRILIASVPRMRPLVGFLEGVQVVVDTILHAEFCGRECQAKCYLLKVN